MQSTLMNNACAIMLQWWPRLFRTVNLWGSNPIIIALILRGFPHILPSHNRIVHHAKPWPVLFLTFNHSTSHLLSYWRSRLTKHTYLLIYYTEQSPSWEANRFAASQEIPRILWNPNVHYRCHKCSPNVPILSPLDPIHTPTFHFLKIHLNIILPFTHGSPKLSLILRFPHHKPVYASPLPHTRYMPRPSQSCRLYHPNNIWWGLQIINPLKPKDTYSGRTAPLTSKRCILYIYSTNIYTEYFKHGIFS